MSGHCINKHIIDNLLISLPLEWTVDLMNWGFGRTEAIRTSLLLAQSQRVCKCVEVWKNGSSPAALEQELLLDLVSSGQTDVNFLKMFLEMFQPWKCHHLFWWGGLVSTCVWFSNSSLMFEDAFKAYLLASVVSFGLITVCLIISLLLVSMISFCSFTHNLCSYVLVPQGLNVFHWRVFVPHSLIFTNQKKKKHCHFQG